MMCIWRWLLPPPYSGGRGGGDFSQVTGNRGRACVAGWRRRWWWWVLMMKRRLWPRRSPPRAPLWKPRRDAICMQNAYNSRIHHCHTPSLKMHAVLSVRLPLPLLTPPPSPSSFPLSLLQLQSQEWGLCVPPIAPPPLPPTPTSPFNIGMVVIIVYWDVYFLGPREVGGKGGGGQTHAHTHTHTHTHTHIHTHTHTHTHTHVHKHPYSYAHTTNSSISLPTSLRNLYPQHN